MQLTINEQNADLIISTLKSSLTCEADLNHFFPIKDKTNN